ncbi:MAG: hypothetical protein IPL71_22545 [Anaerolineales bacterium]|uniref:hypothetical protein n=1 Tax=Candidatus Villigracilis proximus TaxID=3140683 RepID=UPI0031349690|nr:hypothetical protein [Anaerolineales bacterium]
MEIDFEKLTTSIKQFVIFYVQAFVGILTSPAQTFPSLINSEGGKFPIIKIRTLDTKPFIYAAISLVIGLLLGSSLLVKNAPQK